MQRAQLSLPLSAVFIAAGETERALATLASVDLHAYPELRVPVLNNRAYAKLRSGAPELEQEGCKEARVVFELAPEAGFVRGTWAEALVVRGDPAAALAMLDSIGDGDQSRATRAARALTRGRALVALGREHEAAHAFAEAEAWTPLQVAVMRERAPAVGSAGAGERD